MTLRISKRKLKQFAKEVDITYGKMDFDYEFSTVLVDFISSVKNFHRKLQAGIPKHEIFEVVFGNYTSLPTHVQSFRDLEYMADVIYRHFVSLQDSETQAIFLSKVLSQYGSNKSVSSAPNVMLPLFKSFISDENQQALLFNHLYSAETFSSTVNKDSIIDLFKTVSTPEPGENWTPFATTIHCIATAANRTKPNERHLIDPDGTSMFFPHHSIITDEEREIIETLMSPRVATWIVRNHLAFGYSLDDILTNSKGLLYVDGAVEAILFTNIHDPAYSDALSLILQHLGYENMLSFPDEWKKQIIFTHLKSPQEGVKNV